MMEERVVAAAAAEHPAAVDEHSAVYVEGLAGAVHTVHASGARRQVFRRWDILRYGPLAILRHLWVQLAVLGAMFSSCAYIFHLYQGLGIVQATLASVSTITTIGIYAPAGGITHLPTYEQVSLIVIFLVSVGAAASLVQGVLSQMVDKSLWTEEVLRNEVGKMSGHTIIMGYSYLGKYVAEQLDELNLPYVVIIRHAEHVPGLRREGVPAFSAPVTEFHRTLELVGVRRAGSMICTFEEDPDNLIAILYANKVRPELRIITTVHDRELIGSAQMAGADVVVPTANVLGGLLAVATVSKEVSGVLLSSKIPGRYLAEFTVPAGRKFTFGQLNAIAPILLVFEQGQVRTNPPDDFVVSPGSTILVLASPDTIAKLRSHLGGPVSAPIE
jgi:Trk K+ transport system NAD-binding subunit